jgi:hypothetical protein
MNGKENDNDVLNNSTAILRAVVGTFFCVVG